MKHKNSLEDSQSAQYRNSQQSTFLAKIKEGIKKVIIFLALIFVLIILGIYLFLVLSKKLGNSVSSLLQVDYSKMLEVLPRSVRNKLYGHKGKNRNSRQDNFTHNQDNGLQESLDKFFGTQKSSRQRNSAGSFYLPVEEPIVRVVKQVLPGVVSIALERTDLAYGGLLVDQQAKIGSGFVIDASQGIIVTNRHVVESIKGQTYKVILQNGKSLSITKVLEDPVNDLAFVFVNTAGIKLHALPLGDSSTLALGQQVIAIGTPFGEFPSTVTSGIISGLHRKVTAPADWGEKIYFDVIQTDAAINPGNSGGPLINLAGEVVGINFAKINGADNISFALPINLVKQRLEQYKKYGRFRQAFLGVSVKEIDLAAANYYGVPAGAFVLQVVPNSPAYKAGIKAKDIIVSINKQPVYKVGLINILSQYSVGDTIEIHIKRPIINKDGYGYHFKDITVKAKLADRYDFISSTR